MILKLLLLLLVYLLQQDVGLAKSNITKNVVCYHGTWSTYRPSLGKYDVSDINPFLCTHLMYAFFGIEESGELRIIDPYLDLEDNWGRGNIKKFNALKLQNPTLKTLAAVGGWNEGSKNFSIVANSPQKRERFVRSVVRFIQRHGFDGLDLDWEYPNQRHKLNNDDLNNYITLLKELKEGLEPFGYMLTAAVGSAEFLASISYNIYEVVQYLDLINVMSYDLHGPWDDVTGIIAPLYKSINDTTEKSEQLNVDAIVKYWVKRGAPKEKLMIGVPFYGRSFTLENSISQYVGAPHIGRGLAGQYSLEPGVLGYNEICELLQDNESWTENWEEEQMVPYAYRDRQWVGYESIRSIGLKAQYAVDKELGGIMVWSIESDDFRGNCNGGKYPLLKEINRILFGTTATGLKLPEKISFETNSDKVHKLNYFISKQSPNEHCKGVNGYVRDKNDCSKFYYCEDGIDFNFICPASLKFDDTLMICDYSDRVYC